MKKQFEIYIYLSKIDHVLNLNETLRVFKTLPGELKEAIDDNLITNQQSLNTLGKYMYDKYGIDFTGYIAGIYFGQETCENLIPSLKHLKEAVQYCQENDYQFTYVTPYVGPKGMRRVRNLLEYLNGNVPNTEVVVNDYGVLHIINQEYKNLKPVLGRLLMKMKRDPRFSLSGYDISNAGLKRIAKIENNQRDALQGASLELPAYQEFLKSKGMERVSVDSVTHGLNPKSLKKWNFEVDLFWPWTYITSSRSCSIAAHTQPGKESHPTDEPCKFQCRKYEYTFRSDKKMLPTVFRGNAAWMNTLTLHEELFNINFDRLIYQPYIPV